MKTISLGAIAVVALIAGPTTSSASILVTATEVGGDVVFSGGGSADLGGLVSEGNAANLAGLIPQNAVYLSSVDSTGSTDLYRGVAGPGSFGPGAPGTPSSYTGDTLGVTFRGVGTDYRRLIALPTGYVSNATLSTSTTFSSHTLASLGLNPGTYVWTWGSGGNADSFTLQIGAASPAPEPATTTLVALGLLGAGFLRRRRAR